MKKKALIVSTIIDFLSTFEINDIQILQDMEYEVHCACNSSLCADNIRINALRKMGIIEHNIPFSRNPFSKNNIIAYKELKQLVKEEHFDMIHCHTPAGGVLGRLVAKVAHVPLTIYTAHGFHFYKGAPLKNWILYYPIEKIFSRYTDILITINKEDYKRAKEKFRAKKTIYIPGVGVDTAKFATCKVDKILKRKEIGVEKDAFLLLSIGELSKRKNQKVVIDALARMKKIGELGNIMYIVVGEGNKEEEFKKMIKEYKLQNHIKLLGFRTDIDELCRTADCFVHPSIREGLGIAPLEAMASGLPLISANVNGMKDYTEDGKSGCCVNPIEVNAMVNAIKYMYNDRAFLERCGANNIKTVKEFDIHNTNEIMKKVYKNQ